MVVTGEAKYISGKTGTKQDGTPWFMLKFLDDHSDEFFTAFVCAELYEDMQTCKKHTPVILSMNLTPGQKYFTLEAVEVISI